MILRLRQVIVQATSGCNLNCSYCYVPNRRDTSVMTEHTLEATLSRVLSSELVEDDIELVWHAGEPLLAGRRFYERAIELVEKHNVRRLRVKHSIQTNGVLVDDAWCRFFSQHDFSVGISIDGPAFLHDRERVGWSGRASHRLAMRGYALLKEHGLSPGVICVLTRESLRYPAEILNFFLGHGCEFLCFNLEEVEHANITSSFTRAPDESRSAIVDEYRTFIGDLYDLWRPCATRMVIREFRDVFFAFNELQKDAGYYRRPLETLDLGIITVQRNGDITSFSPELAGADCAEFGNFVIGNVLSDDLGSTAGHPTFLRMQRDIQEGVRRCLETCHFFPVCGGGFTSNKYFENQSFASTETITCLLHRQTLASVLVDKLASTSALSPRS